MTQLALYRKYRSQRFGDVKGQPPVVQTLQAALASGHLSHAYLFTGPKGVGKTSVARLLARGVNCLAEQDRPCGTCTMCVLGSPAELDIIEIDAASNRRIDEIRELRDKINLSPTAAQYKVYIIDEVHMLTTEAFNALLKILEEPPAHVIFILATTEAHKLPETIISRTQRFNFQAIPRSNLETGLAEIAKSEKIKISPEALKLLAEAGGGSFRDAISLLDQVASMGASKVDEEAIRNLLGWGDQAAVSALALAISRSDVAAALSSLDSLTNQGAQIGPVITQLLALWRQALLAASGASNNAEGTVATLAQLGPGRIAGIIETLIKAAHSSLPQLSLEVAMVQLATAGVPAESAAQAPALARPEPVKAAPIKAAATVAATPPSADDLDYASLWPKVLSQVKARNNSLYAVLSAHCQAQIDAKQVLITCRFSFHLARLKEVKNRTIIETALAKTYTSAPKLICQLETATPASVVSQPADQATELVGSALEILGGEVVDE